MKITIIAGGHLKDKNLKALIAEYEKRLQWKGTFIEIPEGKNTTPLFLAKLPKNAYVVALDEKGENLSSQALAKTIESEMLKGHSHFCFLIGTADGFDSSLDAHIHKKISFGKATWPHMMVRLLLMEQLYRAQQIIAGHPYHRN